MIYRHPAVVLAAGWMVAVLASPADYLADAIDAIHAETLAMSTFVDFSVVLSCVMVGFDLGFAIEASVKLSERRKS